MTKAAKVGRPKSPTSKSVPFSLRLEPSVRAALQREADDEEISLSELIHRRLKGSSPIHDPQMRALFHMIDDVAGWCRVHEASVMTSPRAFEAFKVGVAALLDKLTPPGPIRALNFSKLPELPSILVEAFKTPQGMGATVADLVYAATQAYGAVGGASDAPKHSASRQMPKIRKQLGIEHDTAPMERWAMLLGWNKPPMTSLTDLGKPNPPRTGKGQSTKTSKGGKS